MYQNQKGSGNVAMRLALNILSEQFSITLLQVIRELVTGDSVLPVDTPDVWISWQVVARFPLVVARDLTDKILPFRLVVAQNQMSLLHFKREPIHLPRVLCETPAIVLGILVGRIELDLHVLV